MNMDKNEDDQMFSDWLKLQANKDNALEKKEQILNKNRTINYKKSRKRKNGLILLISVVITTLSIIATICGYFISR
jgi:hypothetical protein